MKTSRRIKILLVEDDPVHARLMRRAFGRERGKEDVVHLTDGPAAIDFLLGSGPDGRRDGDEQVDLILLDLQLPTLDGFCVLEALRRDDHARSLPVVIVSTSDDPEDVRRGYQLGANAFIGKDPDFTAFSSKLGRLYVFFSEVAELPESGGRG